MYATDYTLKLVIQAGEYLNSLHSQGFYHLLKNFFFKATYTAPYFISSICCFKKMQNKKLTLSHSLEYYGNCIKLKKGLFTSVQGVKVEPRGSYWSSMPGNTQFI